MCKRSQAGTVVTTFLARRWLGGKETTLVSGEALRMRRQAFSVPFKITHRDRIYKYEGCSESNAPHFFLIPE